MKQGRVKQLTRSKWKRNQKKTPISFGYLSWDRFTTAFWLSKPVSERKMKTGNTEKVMQGKTCSLWIRLDISRPQFKSASCHQFPSLTLGHSFNVSAPQLLTCKMRMLMQLCSLPQPTLPTQAPGCTEAPSN